MAKWLCPPLWWEDSHLLVQSSGFVLIFSLLFGVRRNTEMTMLNWEGIRPSSWVWKGVRSCEIFFQILWVSDKHQSEFRYVPSRLWHQCLNLRRLWVILVMGVIVKFHGDCRRWVECQWGVFSVNYSSRSIGGEGELPERHNPRCLVSDNYFSIWYQWVRKEHGWILPLAFQSCCGFAWVHFWY